MKQSPRELHMEELMRSGVLSGEGFLGDDARPVAEIIEADRAVMDCLGLSLEEFALPAKRAISLAIAALGSPISLGSGLTAVFVESLGALPCPWGRCGRFPKGQLEVTDRDGRMILRMTPLSVHLIEVHGFFQGRGSPYRIEPESVWPILASFRE